MGNVAPVIVSQLVHSDHFVVVVRIIHADPDPIPLIPFQVRIDSKYCLLGILYIAEYIVRVKGRYGGRLQVFVTGTKHQGYPDANGKL
jgi:hypothetical protein